MGESCGKLTQGAGAYRKLVRVFKEWFNVEGHR